MSYGTDPYSAPEKFGLTTIGEIQWGEASWDFDLTVVWKRLDGRFVYAEDSGCSCPSPFENIGVEDLKLIASLSGFQAHLDARNSEGQSSYYGWDESSNIAALLERMHAAGAR